MSLDDRTRPLPVLPGHHAPGILPTVRMPDIELADLLLGQRVKASLFGETPEPVRIGIYQLVGRVGAGGMGVVYRALDPELERTVALKVMHPDLVGAAERIRGEARALARLAHPNIVGVFDVGDHDGRLFIAMEYVEGVTLRAWCEQARVTPPPTWRRWPGASVRGHLRAVLERFLQAARGLQAAHAAGLVHCDFKPENVLVGVDGRVRVVDFGIASASGVVAAARTTGEDLGASTRTAAGEIVGTPAYMAPEQLRGGHVDARADQFAFAVALQEAITGRRPFSGDTLATLVEAVLSDAREPPPRWLPAPLRALIVRGLASEADDRFPDMGALVRALERLLRPPIGRQLALAGAAGFVVTLAGVAVLPAAPPTSDAPLVMRAGMQVPTHCTTATLAPEDPDAYRREADRRTALFAAANPDDPDLDRRKADLLALRLARGDLGACKTVAMTRRSRPRLSTRDDADLRCLWARHCEAPAGVDCPPGLHAAGVAGCRPSEPCPVGGSAQVEACLAGTGNCCFGALARTRFALEQRDEATSAEGRAELRALAEAGCGFGHAELCGAAGELGMDPALARRRACELHHQPSCTP